jgi:feruloyl esterase
VLFPGTGPGSELEWGAYASPQFHIGGSFYQNVAAPDAAVDLDSVNLDGLLPALQSASQAIVAAKPDIEAFFAHGGKLLMYHGTTDGLIPYGSTENFFKRILQTTGPKAVGGHVRFFPVPGMGHCMGGEGADHVDWLTALEQWDDTGTPPEVLIGTHSDPTKSYSRPVCAYPNVPHYVGAGRQTDAGNWRCSAP